MIGRNDPCPCGSGKKYKKCCLGKNDVPMEKLVDEELERILLGIYEQMPDPAGVAELDRYLRQWRNKLDDFWDDESIDGAATEYFFFVARADIWKRYLLKVLNTPIRSTVRSVVEAWQTPFFLFGKLKGLHNGFIGIEETLGDKVYFLTEEGGMSAEKGKIVFGVALPDHRNHPNGVSIVTSLLFIQDGNGALTEEVTGVAEASGFEKSADFYKAHLLDIYKMILARDEDSVRHLLIEEQLTEPEQRVITALESGLVQNHVNSEEIKLLKSVGGMYLLMKQPMFRKPNVIAAALFLSAVDFDLIRLEMTQIEIAKLFDVSTSSMTRQAGSITEFLFDQYAEMNAELDDAGPTIALSVGTDPRITERPNWEMPIRVARADFATLEEIQGNLSRLAHEPFYPEGE